MFLSTFFIILFVTTISIHKLSASPRSWKTVEKLIEKNPYIVALLNDTFGYLCTGTVISKITVLTSGTCVTFNPKRVAAGTAVINRNLSKSSLLDVAYTRLHVDYNFEMEAATEPNVTRMHSNIGLVFVAQPLLKLYTPAAEIRNYYASELQGVQLISIGFGRLKGSRTIVLQYQKYNQARCADPKWYYCICGTETCNKSKTYEKPFGNGAPVLFGDEVVGVAGSTSGTLKLCSTGVKYNIFTVIGPYLGWIKKAEFNTSMKMRARSNAIRNQASLAVFLYILLVINK